VVLDTGIGTGEGLPGERWLNSLDGSVGTFAEAET
jgi:hypothetical protein